MVAATAIFYFNDKHRAHKGPIGNKDHCLQDFNTIIFAFASTT